MRSLLLLIQITSFQLELLNVNTSCTHSTHPFLFLPVIFRVQLRVQEFHLVGGRDTGYFHQEVRGFHGAEGADYIPHLLLPDIKNRCARFPGRMPSDEQFPSVIDVRNDSDGVHAYLIA